MARTKGSLRAEVNARRTLRGLPPLRNIVEEEFQAARREKRRQARNKGKGVDRQNQGREGSQDVKQEPNEDGYDFDDIDGDTFGDSDDSEDRNTDMDSGIGSSSTGTHSNKYATKTSILPQSTTPTAFQSNTPSTQPQQYRLDNIDTEPNLGTVNKPDTANVRRRVFWTNTQQIDYPVIGAHQRLFPGIMVASKVLPATRHRLYDDAQFAKDISFLYETFYNVAIPKSDQGRGYLSSLAWGVSKSDKTPGQEGCYSSGLYLGGGWWPRGSNVESPMVQFFSVNLRPEGDPRNKTSITKIQKKKSVTEIRHDDADLKCMKAITHEGVILAMKTLSSGKLVTTSENLGIQVFDFDSEEPRIPFAKLKTEQSGRLHIDCAGELITASDSSGLLCVWVIKDSKMAHKAIKQEEGEASGTPSSSLLSAAVTSVTSAGRTASTTPSAGSSSNSGNITINNTIGTTGDQSRQDKTTAATNTGRPREEQIATTITVDPARQFKYRRPGIHVTALSMSKEKRVLALTHFGFAAIWTRPKPGQEGPELSHEYYYSPMFRQMLESRVSFQSCQFHPTKSTLFMLTSHFHILIHDTNTSLVTMTADDLGPHKQKNQTKQNCRWPTQSYDIRYDHRGKSKGSGSGKRKIGMICSAKWSPHYHNIVATLTTDGYIRIWRLAESFESLDEDGMITAVKEPQLLFTHEGHEHGVTDFAWHPKLPGVMATVSPGDERGTLSTFQVWRPKIVFVKAEVEEVAMESELVAGVAIDVAT